jgi:hypothetical protein
MRSKYIRFVENIAEFYNGRGEKIIYEDLNSGEYRRIDSVELVKEGDTGVYVQHYTILNSNGEETSQTGIKQIDHDTNTLYALDQLFGGA